MATRRKFLIGTAAATAGVAVAAGSATAQVDTTFELELTEDGFVGRAPSSISGTTNPTLEMEAGNRYAIQWTNSWVPESTQSGTARHNLVVSTEDGVLRRGEYVFETGQTRTIRFNAQSSLSGYFCEEHTGEGGDISVSGGATATPEPTTESDMDSEEPTDDGGDGGGGGGGDGGDGGDGGGETSGGGPGFGVGAAVTALGAATYGALRKRDSDE